MPNKKILIVGLGNPGEKYKNSPHNSGFLVIDELIRAFSVEGLAVSERSAFKSQIYETEIKNVKVVLAKPETFMNKSGEAVKLLLAKPYTLTAKHLLMIVHDDVDLELGKLKIVKNRGSAGHKGVEDVIQKLRTKDFIRFRVGIRPKNLPQKRSKSLMNKFVIGNFTKAQDKTFRESIIKCKEAVIFAIENSIEKAMSVYNQK